jgi:hypothetical protein
VEHVLIRDLEHLTGSSSAPDLRFGVEIRDRPGPLHKHGAYEDDRVWIQLRGGLFVARATVRICWVGEYDDIGTVRTRTAGAPIHDVAAFWERRPRYGYAGVVTLHREAWIEPFWAGPRTYGYEWVLLESDAKRASWLEPKAPPRGGEGLRDGYDRWLSSR